MTLHFERIYHRTSRVFCANSHFKNMTDFFYSNMVISLDNNKISNILPATCWGFIGPAFIMNGSPPSKAMIGSAGWPCPLFPLPLWLDSLMISSKSAASPLEDSPFWCLVGWTPSQDTELSKKHVEFSSTTKYAQHLRVHFKSCLTAQLYLIFMSACDWFKSVAPLCRVSDGIFWITARQDNNSLCYSFKLIYYIFSTE